MRKYWETKEETKLIGKHLKEREPRQENGAKLILF